MNEFLTIDIVLLFFVMATAIAVVEMRNLFAVAIVGGIYSLLMALVWVHLDAVDVAFTEAAVGAGISTILILGTLVHVGTQEKMKKALNVPALITVIATGLVLIYGTLDMPRLGDPHSPANTHPLYAGYINQDIQKISVDGVATHAPVDSHAADMTVAETHASPDNDAHEASSVGEEHAVEQTPVDPHAAETNETPDHAASDGDHAASDSGAHHGDYFHGHVPNTVTSVIVSYRAFDTMFETAVIFTAGLAMILLLRRRREGQKEDAA